MRLARWCELRRVKCNAWIALKICSQLSLIVLAPSRIKIIGWPEERSPSFEIDGLHVV
jgi:hypothetical protein